MRVDVAASYVLSTHASVIGHVTNLFNKHYQDVLGFPALGRAAYIGMRFRLGGEQFHTRAGRPGAARARVASCKPDPATTASSPGLLLTPEGSASRSMRERMCRGSAARAWIPNLLIGACVIIAEFAMARIASTEHASRPKSMAALRARHRAGSPRAAENRHQDLLRLLHALWRSAQSNTCPVCLGCPARCLCSITARWSSRCAPRWRSICKCRRRSRFARKNYFYPDLPKGYQISMYELPLATHGLARNRARRRREKIGITRLHLEEDAAKNLHEGFPDSDRYSYVDYNRGGMPLAEIVSEPDMRSPAEAYAYLTALKQVLEYADVSDCNMEEGSLRCDANVSVRRRGAEQLRHKSRSEKSELFPLSPARSRIRNRAPHRRARIRRARDSGNAPLERRRRPHRNHALQGIRPRLSLFPGSRPAAGARRTASLDRNPAGHAGIARRALAPLHGASYSLSAYDADGLTATRALGRLLRGGCPRRRPAKAAASWIQTELLRRLNDAGQILDEPRLSRALWLSCWRRSKRAASRQLAGKKSSRRCLRPANRRRRSSPRRACRKFKIPAKSSSSVPRSHGEKSRQCRQISRRQRRRIQVFCRAGDERLARPGQSADRE